MPLSIRGREYALILLVLGAVVTYLAIPPQSIPLGGDSVPIFNPQNVVRYFSSWNAWVDLGSSVPQVLAGPPITDAIVLSFPQLLGLSESTSAWLFIAIFSIIGALATAYLFRALFPHYNTNQVAAVLAGTFFLVNPSLIVDTFKSLWNALPDRAFFPFFVALFVDGFQKRNLRYSVACGLVSFELLARFPNGTVRDGIPMAGFASVYILANLFVAKHRGALAKFSLLYISTAIATSILVNAYLIEPIVIGLQTFTGTLTAFPVNFYFNNWSSLFNVLRLLSFWGFYNGYVPYYSEFASNIFVIAATTAIPLIAFGVLLVERTRRVMAIVIMTVFLVFLAKGNNGPLGQLFTVLVSIPLMKSFYVSSTVVPFIVLTYSLLIAVFYARSAGLLHKRNVRFGSRLLPLGLLTLLAVSLVTASWPIVTGQVSTNYAQPTLRGVTVPNQYGELRTWLGSQCTNCRMMLAYDPSTYVSTQWGFTGTSQFYQLYYNTPSVTGIGTQYSAGNELLNFLYDPNHFGFLDPASTITLGNITTQAWKAYQQDPVASGGPGFANSSAVVWQTHASDSLHEIAYVFASPQDWSKYDALSVWLSNSSQLEGLWLGIGDNNGNVGWYSPIDHIENRTSGWLHLLVPLQHPDWSKSNLAEVNSVWGRVQPSLNATIKLSLFQLGTESYDSILWARMLAMIGVKWVLRDESITQGGWNSYDILENQSAFHPVFSRDFLTIFENVFPADVVYVTSSLVPAYDIFGIINHVSNDHLNMNEPAFVKTSVPVAPLNSNSVPSIVSSSTSDAYHLQVSVSSQGPFLIVLSQQFDSGWTLQSVPQTTSVHLIVNEFANGWLVYGKGVFSLDIWYSPQVYYSFSMGLSFTALPVLVALLNREKIVRAVKLLGKKSRFRIKR